MVNMKNSTTTSGNGPIVKFHNCLILRNHELINDELWISGSNIIDPESLFYNEKILPDQVVDCKGAIISPGFIDVQLNGEYIFMVSYSVHAVLICIHVSWLYFKIDLYNGSKDSSASKKYLRVATILIMVETFGI